MIGTPILCLDEAQYRVCAPVIGPDEAIRATLAAYLKTLEFQVAGEPPRNFVFEDVFDCWPSPDRDLPYPCASIVPSGRPEVDTASWRPQGEESTFGQFDSPSAQIESSMLWKLGEMTMSLQIDVWTSNFAEQSAVLSRMHGAFAPGERAHRVVLQGSPDYWDLPVRAAHRGAERVETQDAMYVNEFRARLLVSASIDVAELRCATTLRVNTAVEVGTETSEEN